MKKATLLFFFLCTLANGYAQTNGTPQDNDKE